MHVQPWGRWRGQKGIPLTKQPGLVLVKKCPGSKLPPTTGALLQQQHNRQFAFSPLYIPFLFTLFLLQLSSLKIHPLGWRTIKCMKGSTRQKNLSKQLSKNVLVQNSTLNYINIKGHMEDTIRTILSEHFNKWAWFSFSQFRVVFINFLNILIVSNISSKRNLIVEKSCWAGFSLSNSQWKFSLQIWPYM